MTMDASSVKGLTLEQRIAMLEASQTGDMVPASQVRELIEAVRSMFGGLTHQESADRNLQIYQEIGELAKFINSAKKELEDVRTEHIADYEIPNATNQLDAIIKMTEAATGGIMDQCDRLNTFHADLRERLLAMDPPLDPDAMAGVDDSISEATTSITKIYEACNFQDVTGQRIMKVVRALQEIERQVLRMVVVFGLINNADNMDEKTKEQLQHDAELLNGPQLEGQGLEQDDIDALLSKLL